MNEQPLIRFQENQKFGYKNQTGKIIINPIYDVAPEIIEGKIIWLLRKEGKKNTIYISDITGNIKAIKLYDEDETDYGEENISGVSYLADNWLEYPYLVVKTSIDIAHYADKYWKNYYGLIDYSGLVIIPITYSEEIEPLDERGFFKVQDDDSGRYGVFCIGEGLILPTKYMDINYVAGDEIEVVDEEDDTRIYSISKGKFI